MARRSTDLLEVFRSPSEDGGAGRGKSAERRRSGARRKSSRKKKAASGGLFSGFDGLVLAPRQILLASCVMVLMLVLAFTVGLGVGRRGAPAEDGNALSRTTDGTDPSDSLWYVQGRVPRRDVLRGEAVDPDLVKSDLVRLHGFRPGDLRVEEGERGYFFVYYGPFTTEAHARRVLRDHKLGYLGVQGTYPFSLEEVVRVDR